MTDKHILFFDLETSGLPQFDDYGKFGDPKILENYDCARIVQFTWIISTYEKKLVSKQNLIIKPDNFIIPKVAADIHGITTEMAIEKGVSIHIAIKKFRKALKKYNVSKIIAYNIDFDSKVLLSELYRYNNYPELIDEIINTRLVCAMRMAHYYIDRYSKWPKLGELYKKLFRKEMKNAHDALFDVKALIKCYFRLKEMKAKGVFNI